MFCLLASQQLKANASLTVSIERGAKIINDSIYAPQLKVYKKIWIYLPSDYQTTHKEYSVTYMTDGEKPKLTDPSPAAMKGADIYNTLGNFESNNLQSGILVAIVNKPEENNTLFVPFGKGAKGDSYVDFIANTLKPYIDSSYRTTPFPDKTAIMGGKWGSFISLYAWLKYPDVFGKAGLLNPKTWMTDSLTNYILSNPPRSTQKIYIYMSTGENNSLVDDIKRIFKLFKLSGLPESQMVDVVTTEHDRSWEFGVAYQWLFFSNASLEIELLNSKPKLELKKGVVHFTPIDLSKNFLCHVIDTKGKQFLADEKLYTNSINLSNLPKGTYFINLYNKTYSYLYKIVLE